MKENLVLATRNRKKQQEMEQLVDGLDLQILTLRDFPDCPEVIEDGATFVENARKKAVEVSLHTGEMALADDSGLEVDALDGAPGVYSARYARGEESTDEENTQKVLDELGNAPSSKRRGRFVCAAVLAKDGKVLFSTEQTVEGVIASEPKGKGGFGYDPIFYYPPYGKTLAEASPEEKHAVSHRGKALREVCAYLKNQSR
ncbi:MAG: XTP/dITP diphosphatase [Candidatus Omnitrophica bacterium]|nr:XTP/dITP diphosphatase [Candidatus Omnitrophota bacterium]